MDAARAAERARCAAKAQAQVGLGLVQGPQARLCFPPGDALMHQSGASVHAGVLHCRARTLRGQGRARVWQ